MGIIDLNKKPYVSDRDESVFIGIDLPFRKSYGSEGYFASTSTTIEAVKNNIRLLLQTEQGERILQPNLGMNLRRFLFEQFTPETLIAIETDIVDTFGRWLPFVEIQDIKISMDDNDTIGKNQLSIYMEFNITQDPNTLESIQVEIGE